jgi:hypothetical protein
VPLVLQQLPSFDLLWTDSQWSRAACIAQAIQQLPSFELLLDRQSQRSRAACAIQQLPIFWIALDTHPMQVHDRQICIVIQYSCVFV